MEFMPRNHNSTHNNCGYVHPNLDRGFYFLPDNA